MAEKAIDAWQGAVAEVCPTGTMFPAPFKNAAGLVGYLVNDALHYSIVDEVQVPSKEGDYVLQWRWDNEQTPQVWTTCADVEVLPAQAGAEKSKDSGAAALGRALAAAAAFLVAAFVA